MRTTERKPMDMGVTLERNNGDEWKILDIEFNGAAARARLEAGDAIVKVCGVHVSSALADELWAQPVEDGLSLHVRDRQTGEVVRCWVSLV